jgi:hypothetical protein
LRKRQTAKQEKELSVLKKDHSNFKLSNHRDLGRFLYPEIFPYANQERLKRNFKEGVIEELNDVEIVFPNLSNKHQQEILTSDQFMRTMSILLDNAEMVKPKNETDNFSSSVVYQNFFNVGFEGLIKTMPKEFQEHLTSQVKPVIQLMYAITKNYNKLSKNKIPEPQFPKLLLIDKLNNSA